MRLIILISLTLFIHVSAIGQPLTMVELNCENLFDYRDDEGKQDEDYLPEATRSWTKKRYWRKQNHIAQILLSCVDKGIPDLIALCEVENDSTLYDLCHRSLLRNAGYEYLITNSPDVRGIDVALLYSPFTFVPIHHQSIRIEPIEGMRPTRDILYVCGLTRTDTLHVFVVHMPSRFGGERYSRPFRQVVADRLCQQLDSLQAVTSEPKIFIAGDFNDDADSQVLQQIYKHGIHNLTKGASAPKDIQGTYRYKGEWESIDHILGSPNIYNKVESSVIHAPQFLLEAETHFGGKKPFRTYNGMRYQPGYSDHLPLVVRIGL